MKKQDKKPNRWILFAVAAVALLSVGVFVYAREIRQHGTNENVMDMMGGKDMEQMTKNLDQDAKWKMDKMHGQYENLHKEESLEGGIVQ